MRRRASVLDKSWCTLQWFRRVLVSLASRSLPKLPALARVLSPAPRSCSHFNSALFVFLDVVFVFVFVFSVVVRLKLCTRR